MGKQILFNLLKSIAIVIVTMVTVIILNKIIPPPKGTGFDNLKYVLLPFYVSCLDASVYLVLAFLYKQHNKLWLVLALAVSIGYTMALFFTA